MRLVFAISCFRKGSRRINLFLKAKEYQVVFFFLISPLIRETTSMLLLFLRS